VPDANLTLGNSSRSQPPQCWLACSKCAAVWCAGVQAAGTLNGDFHYTSQSDRPPLISGEVALASLSLTLLMRASHFFSPRYG